MGIIIIIGLVIGLGESGGSSAGESSVSRTESREPSSSRNTTSKKAEPEKTQERKANSSYIENYNEVGGICLHKVKSSWREDYIEFGFCMEQAQAIIDMRLRMFCDKERKKISEEIDSLRAYFTNYENVLW